LKRLQPEMLLHFRRKHSRNN